MELGGKASGMMIKKLLIKNYKSIEEVVIEMQSDVNIFVGENDSGKSTILEAISIVSTGNLNGRSFEKQIKANLFNQKTRGKYIASLKSYTLVFQLSIHTKRKNRTALSTKSTKIHLHATSYSILLFSILLSHPVKKIRQVPCQHYDKMIPNLSSGTHTSTLNYSLGVHIY